MRVTMIALIMFFAASGLYAQPPRELDALVDEGRDAMYRLEYPRAREVFGQVIERYPGSPVGHGMLVAASFNELLYTAANPILDAYGTPNPYSGSTIYKPIETESRRFHEATDRLIELTEGILEEDPGNAEAMYFRGLAEEYLAAEAIVIDRAKFSAARHGNRAKNIHESVLELDPDLVDAKMSVAAYEYAMGTLPFFFKLSLKVVSLGTLSGDKDRGFELMDEVAREGRYRDTDAQVLLSLMHAAKGDPARSVELLQALGRRYPESYLIDLNVAAVQELRIEDPEAALATYEALFESLTAKTPGLGEGEVQFLIGRTLFRLDDYTAAEAAFERAIESPTVEQETEPLSYFYLGRVQEELGCNTCCGASNVSFGLPNRAPINATFLAMAIASGLTSAITNPIEHEIKQAIMAADVLMGHDENCSDWIDNCRETGTGTKIDAPQRSRRRRRRERGGG